MIKMYSSSKTKRKERMMKQIKELVDYSGERRGRPFTFQNNFSFSDCLLPATNDMQPGIREQYIRSVIDEDMKSDLEDSVSINWCLQAIKLLPVYVPKDGNCLLHAASVAVWGVEDNKKTLRQLMLMTIKVNDNFHTRWKNQLEKDLESQEISQTVVVDKEWNDVISSISDLGSNTLSAAIPHRFLESIHVYILANILRRPIIILTNGPAKSVMGHDLQENNLRGLYLPLEWTPLECCKTPIILGYSFSHFCPLLSEETQTSPQLKKSSLMFPLVHNDFSPLLVKFLKKEEDSIAWDLVQSYLLVKEVGIVQKDTLNKVPFVLMSIKPLHYEQNSLLEHLELLKKGELDSQFFKASKVQLHSFESATQERKHPFYDIEMKSQTEVVPVRMLKHLVDQNNTRVCVAEGCTKPGRTFLDNFCSDCFIILAAAAETISSSTIKTEHKNTISNQILNVAQLSLENIVHKNSALGLTPSAPMLSLEPSVQDSLHLSMMTERCIKNCGYRCSNKTYPYCHECSRLNRETTKQSSNTVASLSSQNSKITELELNNRDINRESKKSNDASSLFINQTSENSYNPQLLEKENDISESPLISIMENKTILNLQPLEDIKSLIQNIQIEPFLSRQHVEIGTVAQSVEQIAETNTAGGNIESFAETDITSSMTGDIEVSEEPPCIVTCAVCQNLISPPDKLCSKCREIMRIGLEESLKRDQKNQQASIKHQPEIEKMNSVVILKPSHDSKQLDARQMETNVKTSGVSSKEVTKKPNYSKTSKGKHCISPKCENYGDPQMNNMCSSCYFKLNPSAKPQTRLLGKSRKHDKTPGPSWRFETEQPMLYNTNFPGVFSQTEEIKSSQEALIASPAYPKHTSDMIKYGMHATEELHKTSLNAYATLQSFQQFDPESYPSFQDPKSVIVTSKTGQNTYESFHALPPNSTYSFSQKVNETFDPSFQGIEKILKPFSKKCLNAQCQNYGNKEKEGFCNACYKVIRRQRILEKEAKFGANVPDSLILESI